VAARRRRRASGGRASTGYTIAALVLLGAVALFALGVLRSLSPAPTREGPISVLVLNGCGAEGVGIQTAKLLRSHGFDVVDFRNADRFDYPETIVVDQTGDIESAVGVAKLLHVSNVIQQVPETPLVDVVIIIGADHATRFAG
jgi:hypothetical protein